jgi:HSP20 family molecular chaperone IbpA
MVRRPIFHQERKLSMNTLVRENRDGDRAQAEQFVAPSASVIEAADGYTLRVETPGVNKQGLEVSVENQRARNRRAPSSPHCGRDANSS